MVESSGLSDLLMRKKGENGTHEKTHLHQVMNGTLRGHGNSKPFPRPCSPHLFHLTVPELYPFIKKKNSNLESKTFLCTL